MKYLNAIEGLWNDVTRIWTPPPKISYSQWLDDYYYIPPGGPSSGKWHTLPYQREIADCMTDPLVEKITWKKSARVGYTLLITGLLGYYAHQDPRNVLVVQPTIEDAQGYSKGEIASLFKDIPVLEEILPETKTRDSKNTILRKELPGMTLYIIGANSARGFRRISAGTVIFDEVDGYPASAGAEGDQLLLGYKRAEWYWNKKFIHGSTPTDKDASKIDDLFEESDQRFYNVPCPFCEHKQPLEWEYFDFSDLGTVDDPVYRCRSCPKPIKYEHHRWMMENGIWIPTKDFEGHAGFHLWAAYSYSPNATWRHIVKAFMESKGDPFKLKTWVNTWRGDSWEEEGEKFDPKTLMDRQESFDGIMPEGSAILTATVDVQKDRLEVIPKAWGRDEESWTIERIIMVGNPAKQEIWNKLDTFLTTPYPHENGSQVQIHCTLIDSGGHHTDQVYKFVKDKKARNIYALKGAKAHDAPILSRPKKSSKRSKAYKYDVDLITVGVNVAKDLVSARMKLETPGAGYVHFGRRLTSEYFEQLASEKRMLKYIRGRKYHRWEPKRPGIRNESWDLEVYHVAAVRLVCPTMSILNQYVENMEKHGMVSRPIAHRRRIISKGVKLD